MISNLSTPQHSTSAAPSVGYFGRSNVSVHGQNAFGPQLDVQAKMLDGLKEFAQDLDGLAAETDAFRRAATRWLSRAGSFIRNRPLPKLWQAVDGVPQATLPIIPPQHLHLYDPSAASGVVDNVEEVMDQQIASRLLRHMGLWRLVYSSAQERLHCLQQHQRAVRGAQKALHRARQAVLAEEARGPVVFGGIPTALQQSTGARTAAAAAAKPRAELDRLLRQHQPLLTRFELEAEQVQQQAAWLVTQAARFKGYWVEVCGAVMNAAISQQLPADLLEPFPVHVLATCEAAQMADGGGSKPGAEGREEAHDEPQGEADMAPASSHPLEP